MNKFDKLCYDALIKVPRGRITTYKEIAKVIGTRAYRAVGQAMRRNPLAPKVPCHRVVSSDGRIGGYAFGQRKKIEILKKEGVEIKNDRVKDFKSRFFRLS